MTKPAIDRAIAGLLQSLGVSNEPPIDLDALTNLFGVEKLEEPRMIEDGRLEVEPGHVRLLVRSGLTPTRLRFTIAHELGHLWLMENVDRGVARRLRTVSSDTERLCDDIAASLLMPADWVRRRFAGRVQNLSSIRQLAHITGTSMSAATARLAEVLGWRVALLRWRKENGKWRFIAGSGVPPRLHGRIRSAPETSDAIDTIARKTRRDTRSRVPLLLSDEVVHVDAQISVRGTSAVLLAELSALAANSRKFSQDI